MAYKKDIPINVKFDKDQKPRIDAALKRAGGTPAASKMRELMMNWVAQNEREHGVDS